MIDFDNIDFHPEGLNNYLDWGFSILEQTPLEIVKFLPPNAELRYTQTGEIEIKQLPDPVDDWLGFRLSETDIIDLLREKVLDWEKNTRGDILLPISGGADSRLLAYLMPDKSKIEPLLMDFLQNKKNHLKLFMPVIFVKSLIFDGNEFIWVSFINILMNGMRFLGWQSMPMAWIILNFTKK